MDEFTKLFRIKLDKHILPQRIQELGYEACNRLDAASNLLKASKNALLAIYGGNRMKRENETYKMYFWRMMWRLFSRLQSMCSKKFNKEWRKENDNTNKK